MATSQKTRSIFLTGTEQPDEVGRIFQAGPLSVEFDNGNLRYVQINGVEVIRSIAFLVRDENWGTFQPTLSAVRIEQSESHFAVSYNANCSREGQALGYSARIEGSADGSLRFDATAMPETDFLTARTGFVVLHPLDGVVGQPLKVTHTDGRVTHSRFPELVNPDCPFRDIRELEHETPTGMAVRVRMEGDAFEMEDHRNWTDASFKTYVRPLSRPWPYVLPRAAPVTQSVRFSVSGKLPSHVAQLVEGVEAIRIAESSDRQVPVFGLGVPYDEASVSADHLALLKVIAPNFIVCGYDPRQDHGVPLLKKYADIARQLKAEVMLEVVVLRVDGFAEELQELALQIREAGLVPESVALCPAGHLKAVLPGGIYPPAPDLDQLYLAARKIFPGIKIGGGMFSFFTELNRKRPPIESLDFITNTTCPIVHAADDRSVMETLTAIPWQMSTARDFSNGTPHRVGPSNIGARDNPHGATFSANPGNERICLAKMDPRQRSLFGAAWFLGYAATLAYSGADRISLAAPTGSLGLIYRPTDYRQPYFDELPARKKKRAVYPAFHVVAALTQASSARLLDLHLSEPAKMTGIAWQNGDQRWLLVGNLTADTLKVRLQGFGPQAVVSVLDSGNFPEATTDVEGFRAKARVLNSEREISLDAYAVACVHDSTGQCT